MPDPMPRARRRMPEEDEPEPAPVEAEAEEIDPAPAAVKEPAPPALRDPRDAKNREANTRDLIRYGNAVDEADARREEAGRKETERAAAVAAKQAKVAENVRREADYRTRGVKTYINAAGEQVAERDEEGGERYDARKFPVEYDGAGRAVQRERDERGNVTATDLDADAEIGTSPERPHELYRKNKHRAWEMVGTVEEGLKHPDERVRAAAEKGRTGLERDFGGVASKALQMRRAETALKQAELTKANLDWQTRQRATEEELSRLKADPVFNEREGGVFGQFGAKPTAAAAALQARAKEIEEARNAELPPADPKSLEEERSARKVEYEGWKALVETSGGVAKAEQKRKADVLAAGGKIEDDPVLSALAARRKELGMADPGEAIERDMAREKARKDPRLAEAMAAQEAAQADFQRGAIGAEEANARITTANAAVRTATLPDAAKHVALLSAQAEAESDPKKRAAIEQQRSEIEAQFTGEDFEAAKGQAAERLKVTQASMAAAREGKALTANQARDVARELPPGQRQKFIKAWAEEGRETEMLKAWNGGEVRDLDVLDATRIGVARMTAGFIGNVAGAARLVGNLLGASSEPGVLSGVADWSRARREELPMSPSVRDAKVMDGALKNPRWWLENGLPTVLEFGADLGIASLTGPAAPYTFMALGGAKMAGEAYNEAEAWHREHGKSAEDAQWLATSEGLIVGSVGALLDRIPAGEFFIKSGAGKQMFFNTVRSRMARRGLSGFAAESLPEMGQELTAMLAEAGFRDASEAFHDGTNRILTAGVLGGAMGSGADILIGASYDRRLRKNLDELRTVNGAMTDTGMVAAMAEAATPEAIDLGAMDGPTMDAQLAEIRERIESASKVGDLEGLQEAYGERLGLASQMDRAMKTSVAVQEIAALQIDGAAPEVTAATQLASRALVKIANGQPMEALTAAERAAVEAPAPDGLPRIEKVGKGVVITDGTLARMRETLPETSKLMPESEAAQRQALLAETKVETSGKRATAKGGENAPQGTTDALGTFEVEVDGEPQPRTVQARSEQDAVTQVAGDPRTRGMVRGAVPISTPSAIAPEKPTAPDPAATARRTEDAIATNTRIATEARAKAPEVVRRTAKIVQDFTKRYGSVFSGVKYAREAAGMAGAVVETQGERDSVLSVNWDDLAAEAGSVYSEALASGATEAVAVSTAEKRVRRVLDEELKHAVDRKVWDDAETEALWTSLPAEIQSAAQRIYTRANPNARVRNLSPVAWGREYKRMLLQAEDADGVSELAHLTMEQAKADIAKNRDASWVKKVVRALQGILDFLTSSKASAETVRQVAAVRAELRKIETLVDAAPSAASGKKTDALATPATATRDPAPGRDPGAAPASRGEGTGDAGAPAGDGGALDRTGERAPETRAPDAAPASTRPADAGDGGAAPGAPVGDAGTYEASTPNNRGQVTLRLTAIELGDLESSAGTELQPRDRSRAGNREQEERMARRWNPRLSAPSNTTDSGPIIFIRRGGEAVNVSGHGRQNAQRLLYSRGGEAADANRDFIKAELARAGRPQAEIDAVEAMRAPLLAAELTDLGSYAAFGDVGLLMFVRDSNVEGMSDGELAASDANILSRYEGGKLLNLRINEAGQFYLPENRQALVEIFDLFGRPRELRTAEGEFTEKFDARLRGAMMAVALGPQHTELINSLLEQSGDLGIKRLVGGVLYASPDLARLSREGFDLGREVLTPTLQSYLQFRRDGGRQYRTIFDFIDQRVLPGIGENLSPAAKGVLEEIADEKGSAQSFGQTLVRIARREVQRATDERAYGGADLFSEEKHALAAQALNARLAAQPVATGATVAPTVTLRALNGRGEIESVTRTPDAATLRELARMNGIYGLLSRCLTS